MIENLQNLKYQTKTMWASGSYGDVSYYLLPASSHLVKSTNLQSDELVLDVACGNGITAITARKQNAKVTGLDLTPELLAWAREDAAIAKVNDIEWKEGDAEDLPFDDDSFDVVLSSFGHMFVPRPEICASELVRVTKSGGRIGFTTWPPELAVGGMFTTISKYIQQPHDAPPSPLLWGNPDVVRERLISTNIKELHFERGCVNVSTLSLNHYWQYMSTKFGPLINAVRIVNDDKKINSLKNDYIHSLTPYYADNILRLDYLVTIAVKA
jgi:SAM-dependent methyltransferase